MHYLMFYVKQLNFIKNLPLIMFADAIQGQIL